MIVLDTNVVSELMRQAPEATVVSWVDQYPADEVFITAVTAAELQYGVALLPEGRRKTMLTTKVRELLSADFQDRVLPFDGDAATHYARIAASREHEGRPISMADAQIAAICRLYGAHLVTRNTKDFADTGIRILNPWDVTLPRREA